MSIVRHRASAAAPTVPHALAAAAWGLELPLPHERKGILREEAAQLVDGLLARVARGSGALDVAIGEGLASLCVGDRLLRLGFSGIGDYARERLGIPDAAAKRMARLAASLRDRPLLCAAVRAGDVSARKAAVILRVARGDAEQMWVERARASTVRKLEADVRAAVGVPADPEEPFERLDLDVGPEARARLDEALELAGKVLGRGAPRWQRLEAICQEFLSERPAPLREDDEAGDAEVAADARLAEWFSAAREGLEEETACWAALESVPPVAAPGLEGATESGDLHRHDAELRSLASMRDRWDELVGHLGLLLSEFQLWKEMGFASLAHYCDERLGMAVRALQQRVTLERRLYALPALRTALRDGRLSYEQARLVASVADEGTLDSWIARAEGSTCIALKREIEASADAQMCASSELTIRVPRRVARLVEDAFRAAREAAGCWLSVEECLVLIADHFIMTWRRALRTRSTPATKVLARDGGWCRVPGCSRPAQQAHHVVFRSHGGSDDLANQVSACAAHHLHGIHAGSTRVRGSAPDGLVWELGVNANGEPLLVFKPPT